MSAVVYRQPTDLKGEMATVGAVLSWADRTDARPQPEPASAPPLREALDRGASLHPGEVPDFVKDGEPYDIRVEAGSIEPPSRDGGNGAGALPFQGAEQRIREDIEHLAEASPEYEEPGRVIQPEPEPRAVAPDGEPVLPRPAHDDDVDDGLSGVGGEDLSEIPEHLRG